jgi:hypothetical protein
MNPQLLKLSFDQGYEDTLVALGLEKQAFIGALGKGLWTGAKFLGRQFLGKPAAGAVAPKNVMGVVGTAADFASKPVTQVGFGIGKQKFNEAVTNATV